jgi:protein-S-isoprenylcysteine O-methyltransferase Ste14
MKTFVVNIALTLIVGVAATSLIWKRYSPEWSATQYVGTALLMFGFVMWTIARFQLGASLTVSAQARQLVSRGLYSKIRNPIYVFGSCFIAGFILVAARPVWLLIFALIVPMQIWRAGKESLVLEAKFGEEYRRYRAGTWF